MCGGRRGKNHPPLSPHWAPPSGNPGPPFLAGGGGCGWSLSHPSTIQARSPFLSFSEKLCVSTGVAGVLAPGDCACARAGGEKCRLGENPSQARRSPRAQGALVGRECWERARWLARRRAPAAPGAPLRSAGEGGPHKATARSRAAGSLPPSLLPFHIPPLSPLPSFPLLPPSPTPSLPFFLGFLFLPLLFPSFLCFSFPSHSFSSFLLPRPFLHPPSHTHGAPANAPSAPSCTQLLGERLYLTTQELSAYREIWWVDPAMRPMPSRGSGLVLLGALLYLEGQGKPLQEGRGNWAWVSVFQVETRGKSVCRRTNGLCKGWETGTGVVHLQTL